MSILRDGDSMEEREEEFLAAVGLSMNQLKKMPDFFVRTGRDKVRLTLRSKLEPVMRYADWVSVTVSPKDFVYMCHHLPRILEDLQKNQKK